MTSRVIELKCWPEPFLAIKRGEKTFEARLNDRGFMIGDTLRLKEFDPNKSLGMSSFGYSGNYIDVEVTYILHGGKFGIDPSYVVISIKKIEETEK